MAQNATSAGSLHVTTADALTYRGLEFIEIDERRYPRSLEDIRKEFRRVVEAASSRRILRTRCCGENKNQLFSDESVAELQAVMTRCHEDEIRFDEALFKAFEKCLPGFYVGGGKNAFVLRSHNGNSTDRYAVGFARQVKPGLELIPTIKETEERADATSSTSAGLEANSQADHAVCLFERVGRKWKIKECFVMIELKTNETNCVEFETDEDSGSVSSVDLRSKQGALAQELLYTMGSVVLYHARNGIWENQIPMAVIAGRKETTGEAGKRPRLTTDRLRWVSASLCCPEKSGDVFTFTVDGYGHFYRNDTTSDAASAEQAVRLFLDTMLCGLKQAIKVRNKRNDGTTRLLPVPASGGLVYVGQKKLEVSFYASPIRGAETLACDSQGQPWRIHQADLFRGNVNLREILAQPDLNVADFRSHPDFEGETTVLVKVSSTAVHSLLVSPPYVMLAMGEVLRGNQAMVNEISSVLHVAVNTSDVGLVTIMSDLSAEYKALTPAADADHLPALWAGFTNLVKDVLLPMAKRTVIHPDIRPGYDVTFNILCKLEGDGPSKTAKLKLIDLESLVRKINWRVPIVKGKADGRFLPARVGRNATAYVWWQCVYIAYVWSEKIKAGDGSGIGVVSLLQKVLVRKTMDHPAWLVALRPHVDGGEIDDASVESTLTALGSLFE